jgi:hypothetical protein
MIAGPGWVEGRMPVFEYIIHKITIRVEHTDLWYLSLRQPFLAACLTQKVLRRENRRHVVVFPHQNGPGRRLMLLVAQVSSPHIETVQKDFPEPARRAGSLPTRTAFHRETARCVVQLCQPTGTVAPTRGVLSPVQ